MDKKTVRRKAAIPLLWWLLAAALLVASPASGLPSQRISLEVDGTRREALLRIPPQVKNARLSAPAVIVFHGGGGNAEHAERMSLMSWLADKKGFVAVYPEGTRASAFIGNAWNAGGCCGAPARKKIDDVKFVSLLIDELVANYNVDSKQIYLTGLSNGAMMAYRAGCELSEKVAAIAPIAGQRVDPPCVPKKPLSVIHFHGTDDRCALFGGGSCGGCLGSFLGLGKDVSRWDCPAVSSDVAALAKERGCQGERREYFKRGAVTCESYGECPEKAEVVLCSIHGGGHTWPSGTYGAPFCARKPKGRACRKMKLLVGEINTDIAASEMMLDFFSRHRLK